MLTWSRYTNPFLNVQLPILLTVWACLEIRLRIRKNKILESTDTIQMCRNSSFAHRAKLLIRNGIYITNIQYEMRKASYFDENTGFFTVTQNNKSWIDQIKDLNVSGPMVAFKEHVFYRLSQGIAWLLIYSFMGNSLAGAFPFEIPYGYKPILQIGLKLKNLSSNYVSPLSWYLAMIYLIEDLVGLLHLICSTGTIFANFFITNPRNPRLLVSVDNSFRIGTLKNMFEHEINSLSNFVHYFQPHNAEFQALGILNRLVGSEHQFKNY